MCHHSWHGDYNFECMAVISNFALCNNSEKLEIMPRRSKWISDFDVWVYIFLRYIFNNDIMQQIIMSSWRFNITKNSGILKTQLWTYHYTIFGKMVYYFKFWSWKIKNNIFMIRTIRHVELSFCSKKDSCFCLDFSSQFNVRIARGDKNTFWKIIRFDWFFPIKSIRSKIYDDTNFQTQKKIHDLFLVTCNCNLMQLLYCYKQFLFWVSKIYGFAILSIRISFWWTFSLRCDCYCIMFIMTVARCILLQCCSLLSRYNSFLLILIRLCFNCDMFKLPWFNFVLINTENKQFFNFSEIWFF